MLLASLPYPALEEGDLIAFFTFYRAISSCIVEYENIQLRSYVTIRRMLISYFVTAYVRSQKTSGGHSRR